MPTYIAETPLHGLTKLTPSEQTAVKAAIFDLQLQPDLPSFQLHRVQAPDDGMWSARVDLDVRLILHKRGDTTVLCFVDHHDAAYAWAGRRRLDVHETTGAAQFVVTIIGAEAGELPLERVLDWQADEAARAAFLEPERNLLYVACTRARERLLVTGVREMSAFLATP